MSLERDGFLTNEQGSKIESLKVSNLKIKNLDVNAVAQEYIRTLDRVGDLWKKRKVKRQTARMNQKKKES